MPPCGRCGGGGTFYWGPIINGVPRFSGPCFRCQGGGQYPARRQAPISGASDAPQPTPTAPLKPQAASRRASRPTPLAPALQARLQAATASQEAK